MSNKEIIAHFKTLIEQRTGQPVTVNYGRMMKGLKKIEPLLEGLNTRDTETLLTIIVDHYSEWSDLRKYPLVMEVITRSWVIERALALLHDEKNKQSQIVKQSVVAGERQQIAIDSIMERIRRKEGKQ